MAAYVISIDDTVTSVDARLRVTVDNTPPILTPVTPLALATDVPADVTITFDLQDFLTGVDDTTIEVYANGDLICTGLSAVADWTVTTSPIQSGYRFYLTPPNGFQYGQTVTIRVVAYDNS